MRNSDDTYDNHEEVEAAVQRYEASLLTGTTPYFDVEEYLMIIDYYMMNDRIDEALKAYNSASKLHGGDPELVLMKARIDIAQGNFKQALKRLEPISELLSDNCDYYLTKAAAILELDNDADVIDLFNKALETIGDGTPDEMYDIFSDIASIYEHVHQYENAVLFYKKALEFADDDAVELIFKIGFCIECLGRWDEAIKYYNEAIDINPFSELAWYNIGIAYGRMGDFDKAIEAYNYAIALDPSFSDAIFNKGNAYCNSQKYAEALECYTEYLQIFPESISARCYMGECYVHLGEIDKAEEIYDNILREQSDTCTDAWFGKAMVCGAREQYEKGIEMLHKLLSIDNEHDLAWFRLGVFNLMLDKNADALIAFEKSLELNKYNVDAWRNTSLILILENNYKLAEEKLEEAVELYLPDEPQLLYTLAAVAFMLDDEEKCLRTFKKAFNIAPDLQYFFLSMVPKYRLPAEIKKMCRLNKRKKKKNDNNINNNTEDNEQ